VVIALAVVVLGGCASAPSAPAPAPSATPTLSPTKEPLPRAAAPAFAGDCSAALSDAELAVALGTPSARFSSDWSAAHTAGGILCTWRFGDWGTAHLTIYPVEIVAQEIAAAYALPSCDPEAADGMGTCSSSLTTDSSWILIDFFGGGLSAASPPPGFDDALATVAARLESAGAPVAAERTAEWWSMVDCASFAEEIDVASRLGDDFDAGYPTDGVRHVSSAVAEAAGVMRTCEWYAYPGGGSANASVTIYAGAAPLWGSLVAGLDGAQPAQVVGATDAVAWVDPTEPNLFPGEGVLVSDGTNILAVRLEGSATDAPGFAVGVLAAL